MHNLHVLKEVDVGILGSRDRSQEVIVHSFSQLSHCNFSVNGSLQNTRCCLCAGMLEVLLRVCIVNTSSVTLRLAAGKGRGVAGVLSVTCLRALPLVAFHSCCRTGLAMAQKNPVADALCVLTQ